MCSIGNFIVILVFIVINVSAITQTINGDNGNVESISKGIGGQGHISMNALELASVLNEETNSTPTTRNPAFNIENNRTTKETTTFETLLSEVTTNSMTMQKIEISASNFNKNSLQQNDEAQQVVAVHQQHHKPSQEQLPQQRHHEDQYSSLDNKHEPCEHTAPSSSRSIVTDGVESVTANTNSSITIYINISDNTTRMMEYGATAKGPKPLISPNTLHGTVNSSSDENNNDNNKVNNSPSPSPSPSPSLSPSPSSTFNVARNGFRDKINISNQQNEFTRQVDGNDDVDDGHIVVAPTQHDFRFDSQVQLVTSATGLVQKYTNIDSGNGISSHRNRREGTTHRRQLNTGANSANNYVVPATSSFFEHVELLESRLSSDKRSELRLHRRKRYLVFPEGSSFQLVFDLIIGIVDYTSYAILGITCSVAWELPSKPPSEIIEKVREKLNEGTFGLHRRNDTTEPDEPLQYIETEYKSPKTSQLNEWKPQKYESKENSEQQQQINYVPKVATPPSPTATRYYSYQAQNEYGKFDGSGGGHAAAAPTAAPAADMAAGVRLAEAQRKTLNEKAAQRRPWKWQWYSPKPDKAYAKYGKYGTKGNYEWRGNDKWKYAPTDWHRPQRTEEKSSSNSDNYNEHDDYIGDSIDFDGMWQQKSHKNSRNWRRKHNWWQSNNQRWNDKQKQWTQFGTKNHNWDGYTTRRPISTYAMPVPTENFQSRAGYQRTLLKEPPKHRIYPVFGRKKRSLERNFPTNEQSKAFEAKLERIHLREQLRSRQKLYAKIEQLFQTRGHNGTACVLRALCETGQRHQLSLHHRRRESGGQRRHCSRSSSCGSQRHQRDHGEEQQQEPHSTAGQQSSGPQSFITELLRAIFSLPRDIRSREFGSQAMHSPPSEEEEEQHISWHYWDAHAYNGDCGERFSSCEHSIWSDGIGHSDVMSAGRAFKM